MWQCRNTTSKLPVSRYHTYRTLTLVWALEDVSSMALQSTTALLGTSAVHTNNSSNFDAFSDK